MNSRQRILAALRREPIDRPALCTPTSIATVELMDICGAAFPDANRVPESMARLAATGYTELGFDAIMPVFSIVQESSALGCRIDWGEKGSWPRSEEHTSELQSLRHLVCRLLLEKKNK